MSGSEEDRAEIIALIHANRIAIWTQDYELYQQCFVHEPYTTRWGWWRPRRHLSCAMAGTRFGGGCCEQFKNPAFNNRRQCL